MLHDLEQHRVRALLVLAPGRPLDAQPPGVGLEAAPLAAGALAPAALDDGVADLTGAAAPAAQAATEDESATDSRTDEHAEQVLVRPPGAAPELPHRCDPHVVVDRDRDAPEGPRHGRAEGDVVHEPGHVGRARHMTGRRIDRARCPDADGAHIRLCGARGADRLAGGDDDLVDDGGSRPSAASDAGTRR